MFTRDILKLFISTLKFIIVSVIVYKDRNGKTQFNTAMFLDAHDKDDEYKMDIKIRKMLNEALETI